MADEQEIIEQKDGKEVKKPSTEDKKAKAAEARAEKTLSEALLSETNKNIETREADVEIPTEESVKKLISGYGGVSRKKMREIFLKAMEAGIDVTRLFQDKFAELKDSEPSASFKSIGTIHLAMELIRRSDIAGVDQKISQNVVELLNTWSARVPKSRHYTDRERLDRRHEKINSEFLKLIKFAEEHQIPLSLDDDDFREFQWAEFGSHRVYEEDLAKMEVQVDNTKDPKALEDTIARMGDFAKNLQRGLSDWASDVGEAVDQMLLKQITENGETLQDQESLDRAILGLIPGAYQENVLETLEPMLETVSESAKAEIFEQWLNGTWVGAERIVMSTLIKQLDSKSIEKILSDKFTGESPTNSWDRANLTSSVEKMEMIFDLLPELDPKILGNVLKTAVEQTKNFDLAMTYVDQVDPKTKEEIVEYAVRHGYEFGRDGLVRKGETSTLLMEQMMRGHSLSTWKERNAHDPVIDWASSAELQTAFERVAMERFKKAMSEVTAKQMEKMLADRDLANDIKTELEEIFKETDNEQPTSLRLLPLSPNIDTLNRYLESASETKFNKPLDEISIEEFSELVNNDKEAAEWIFNDVLDRFTKEFDQIRDQKLEAFDQEYAKLDDAIMERHSEEVASTVSTHEIATQPLIDMMKSEEQKEVARKATKALLDSGLTDLDTTYEAIRADARKERDEKKEAMKNGFDKGFDKLHTSIDDRKLQLKEDEKGDMRISEGADDDEPPRDTKIIVTRLYEYMHGKESNTDRLSRLLRTNK